MSRDFADLRVYKGKEPFSLLTLECLLFSLSVTSLLYLEKIIEQSLFLSSSLIVSGLVFIAFDSLRMTIKAQFKLKDFQDATRCLPDEFLCLNS